MKVGNSFIWKVMISPKRDRKMLDQGDRDIKVQAPNMEDAKEVAFTIYPGCEVIGVVRIEPIYFADYPCDVCRQP